MYLDPREHSAFTGSKVIIESLPGATFFAFDGVLTGKMIHVEPKRLIVQTWRSSNWPAEAMDSVLTLSFWPDRDGARIELVHVNVHDEDFAGVSQGWEKYYWTPLRSFLEGSKSAQ
jgi:activator of HSP90 ATPase